MHAEIIREDGTVVSAEIANLTRSSVFVKADSAPPFRSRVRLRLEGMELVGETALVCGEPRGFVVAFEAPSELKLSSRRSRIKSTSWATVHGSRTPRRRSHPKQISPARTRWSFPSRRRRRRPRSRCRVRPRACPPRSPRAQGAMPRACPLRQRHRLPRRPCGSCRRERLRRSPTPECRARAARPQRGPPR